MLGLAEKIFKNETGDCLDNLVKDGVFEDVDIWFAKKFGDDTSLFFLATMMAFARNGHLSVEIENGIKPDLGSMIGSFEKKKWLEEKVVFGAREIKNLIIRSENRYYLKRNWMMETRVIEELTRLWERDVKQLDIGTLSGINNKQGEAIQMGLGSPLLLLSGGPGTGKTFTIGKIVEKFLSTEEGRIILAAPTGKAAEQLKRQLKTNSDRVEVGTLHSLLKIKESKDIIWKRGYLKAGLMIIDECSMIDISLLGAILRAIQDETRLVLVGDQNQLPPVESGTVFGDLCHFAKEHRPSSYIHLDECIRTERKEILDLAKNVNEGNGIKNFPFKNITEENIDFSEWKKMFPIPTKEMPDIRKLFQEMGKLKILSCMKNGPWGVESINKKMGDLIRKEVRSGFFFPIPIMVTRTSYRHQLCNGEPGILIKRSTFSHLEKEDTLYFVDPKNELRSIPAMLLPSFEYAYCLSVHKSQGSEYDHVALIIPKGSEVFGKELLYTGITRAKASLEILGDEETIKKCCNKTSHKFSGIVARLTKNLG